MSQGLSDRTAHVDPGPCRNRACVPAIALALASLAPLVRTEAANVTWSNASTATAWLTTTNWSSSAVPTTSDVAIFQNTGSATTAGINMNTVSGSYGVQAIVMDAARTRALTIGNSSTTSGTLALLGGTVSGTANVVLRNASSSLFTIQNNETGTGKAMNVALGNATDNVILLDGAGGITISSTIAGAGRNLTLTGVGSGTLTLSAANTYSGTTTVSQGILLASNNSALGTSTVVVNSGAALRLDAGVTISRSITISGAGTNNAGAIYVPSGTAAYSGNVTLGSDLARIGANNAGTQLTVTGSIGSGANAFGLLVRSSNQAGVVQLSGESGYLGATHVAIGTLRLAGGANRLPVGTTLHIVWGASGTNVATFELNGQNQEVAGLSSLTPAGGEFITGTTSVVSNTSTTQSTFTVNTGPNASTFNGILTGNLRFVKAGTNSLTFTGTGANFGSGSTYTGGVDINAGTLVIGHVNALGSATNSVAVNSGTLNLNGISPTVGLLSGSAAAAITSSAAATLTGSSASSAEYAGSITGAVALVKRGAGTLTLSGSSSYTGGTTLNAGGLVLGHTSALGSGSVSLTGASFLRAAATGTVANGFGISPSVTGTFDTQGNTITLSKASAVITGTATSGLVKIGSGTLALGGTATITGTLTVNEGTFLVLNPASVSGVLNAASVIVNNGATFQFANSQSPSNSELPNSTFITANPGSRIVWKQGESFGGINLLGGTLDLQDGSTVNSAGQNGSTNTTWTSGTVTNTGATGPWSYTLQNANSINKTSSGTVTITGNSMLLSSSTGLLNLLDGTIFHAAAVNLGTSTGWVAVTLGSSTTSGTFAYGGATATRGGNFTVNGLGGVVQVDAADAVLSLSGTLAGSGALVKSGSGTLALSASNSYSGALSITAGTLRLDNSSGIAPTATISASTGATLAFNVGGSFQPGATVPAIPGGLINVAQLGSGTLVVAGANTYTGTTIVGAGTLQIGTGGLTGSLAPGGVLTGSAGGTLAFFRSDTVRSGVDFPTQIEGGVNLTQLGSGTLVLAGPNVYTGTTTVAAGMLRVGDGGTTGSILQTAALAVAGGATLVFDRTDGYDGTYAQAISGSGGLVLAGGTLGLAGNSSYTGGTIVTAGSLVLGNANALGDPGGALTINAGAVDLAGFSPTVGLLTGSAGTTITSAGAAVLTASSGADSTFAGAIGGAVSFVKAGSGRLTLSGTSTTTSDTSIAGGTLLVTGSLPTTVAVTGGAVLGGTGSVGGLVTVADLGSISPGVGGVGALTVAAATFSNAGTITMGVQGGTTATLLQVVGDVVPLGTGSSVIFAFGGGLSALSTGTYTLLAYGGTQLTDISAFGWSGTLGARQTIGMQNATQALTLAVSSASPIWSGTAGGDWTTADDWILDSTGLPTSFLTGDTVVFNDAGTTGSVTLSQDVAPLTTTFSGTTLAYTLTSPAGFGITSGALVKTGPATLTISTSNSFAGGTTISSGTVLIGTDFAFGSGGVTVAGPATGITIASDGAASRTLANPLLLGGDLVLGDVANVGAITVTGPVDLAGGVRTLATSVDATLAGTVGNGGLVKAGGGVLTLSGSNSYAAGTVLAAGAIVVGNPAALGTGTATFATATALRAGVSGTLANPFAVAPAVSGTFDTQDNLVVLSRATGLLTGTDSSALVKLGSGTLALAGSAADFGGAWSIEAGTLQVGTSGTAGRLGSGPVTNAGTLAFNRTDNHGGPVSNVISGTGSVVLTQGALTLVGDSTMTGATTIAGGTLQIGSGGSSGAMGSTSGVTVAAGAALAFNRGDTYGGVFAPSIAGAGRVTVAAGVLTLAGTNTHSGGTVLNGGSLVYAGTDAVGSGTVSFAGPVSLQAGLSGTLVNAVAIGSGVSGTFDSVGFTATLDGTVSGSGTLVKAGAGTLTLAAGNSYSGGTTLTAGGIVIGSTTALGTGTVTFAAGSLLQAAVSGSVGNGFVVNPGVTGTFDTQANTVVLFKASGLLSGTDSATFVKIGSGTLSIASGGATTYTGTMNVNGGTVLLTGDLNAKSIVVNSGATFQFGVGSGNPNLPDDTYLDVNEGGLALWTVGENAGGVNLFGGTLDQRQGGVTTFTSGTVSWTRGTLTNTGTFGAYPFQVRNVLDKTTTGTVSISGSTSITGTGSLRIMEGEIYHSGSDNLGTVAVTLGSATTAGTFAYGGVTASRAGTFTVTGSGGTIRVDNAATTLTLSGSFGGTGTLVKAGSGTLALTGTSMGFTGTLNVNEGTFWVRGQGTGSTSGAINSTSIVVNDGGTFLFGTDPSTGNPQLPNTTALTLNPGGTGVFRITEDFGGVNLLGGTLDLQQGVVRAQGAASQSWTSGTLTNTLGTGTFSVQGTNSIAKTTSGTVTITGNVALTGSGAAALQIQEGEVYHASAVNLGTVPIVLGTAASTGTFGYGGATATRGGAFTLDGLGGTVRIDNASAILTLGGTLGGAGDLFKAGPGTLALTSLQAFTGDVTIAAGSLQLVSATAVLQSPLLQIDAGAVLDVAAVPGGLHLASGQMLVGYGTVLGDVTVAGGAQIAPGGSIGTLDTVGTMTWGASGRYEFEITNPSVGPPGTSWDLLTVDALVVTATSGVNFVVDVQSLTNGTDTAPGPLAVGTWNPGFNYAWRFLVADQPIAAFDPAWVTVNSTPFSGQNVVDGSFSVAQGGAGSGRVGGASTANELYLVYVAVPEPGTTALAVAGLVTLAVVLHRRKSRGGG